MNQGFRRYNRNSSDSIVFEKTMQTLKTVFRQCTQADLPVVRQFASQMYLEDSDAHSGSPNMDLTYKHLSSKPDKGRVVVFDKNGQLVGYAIIIFFWSNEFHGDVIDIDELYVDGPYRRTGVAREFFAWLEETYPESVGMSLQVSHSNARAAKLYESIGFNSSPNRHMFRLLRRNI
ncbi:MAG TPA: GNAT family N-acetyltransferase [Candidatus Obscuribacterales bacterium]